MVLSDEERERRRKQGARLFGLQKTWTSGQTREQVARVEMLMIAHLGQGQIIRDLGRDEYPLKCGPGRVKNLMKRVLARWEQEDLESRPAHRAKVIRGAQTRMAELSSLIASHLNARERALAERKAGNKKVVVEDPPMALYREYREHAELLAKFTGVVQEQPQSVMNLNVVVNNATLMAIQNLTEEEKSEMLREANEERLLAEAYRREHPDEAAQ